MYTLRVPFRMTQGRRLAPVADAFPLGGALVARIEGPFAETDFVLVVEGFDSEASASAYCATVRSGMAWGLVKHQLPIDASLLPRPPVMYPEPRTLEQLGKPGSPAGVGEPALGIIDDDWASIFRTDMRLHKLRAGFGSGHVTHPGERLLECLRDEAPVGVQEASSLALALEFYQATFRETSERAKFLVLMIALESLCEPQPRTQFAQAVLASMSKQLDEGIAAATDEVTLAELNAIKNELPFKGKDSIRSQLRRLVTTSLGDAEDIHQQLKKLDRLYTLRSRIAHGRLLALHDDPSALGDAAQLVQRVMKSKLDSLRPGEAPIA